MTLSQKPAMLLGTLASVMATKWGNLDRLEMAVMTH